jgi:hypothetical protein
MKARWLIADVFHSGGVRKLTDCSLGQTPVTCIYNKWSWRGAAIPGMKIVPSLRRKPQSISAIAGFRHILDPGFRWGDAFVWIDTNTEKGFSR